MQQIESLTEQASKLPLAEREQLMFAIQQSIEEDYDMLEKLTLDEQLRLCRSRLAEHQRNPSRVLSLEESLARLRAIS